MIQLFTDKNWNNLKASPVCKKQLRQLAKNRASLNTAKAKSTALSAQSFSVFYGADQQTKLNAAALLGKTGGTEVYRIDLSSVVSKYIGETEKNISKIFEKAHHKDWILFFDEADALFGKRTEVKDAHDKYANTATAHLIERVKNYPGTVIISTKKKKDIDPSALRRTNYLIRFPLSKTR